MKILSKSFGSISFSDQYTKHFLFYVGLLLLVWPVYFRPLEAIDFWKHVYSGRYLAFFSKFPHHATFTFSPAQPSQFKEATDWLGHLYFYYAYDLTGVHGVLILKVLIIVCSLVILHTLMHHRRSIVTFLILTLFAYGLYGKLISRSSMFTVIFFPLLIMLLSRSDRNRNHLWFIVPLLVIWANIHSSFYLGICIVGAWLLGYWIETIFKEDWEWPKQHLVVLVLIIMSVSIIKPMPHPALTKLTGVMNRSGRDVPLVAGSVRANPVQSTWSRISVYPQYFFASTSSGELKFGGTYSWEWNHPLSGLSHAYILLNYGIFLSGLLFFLLSGSHLRFRSLFPFLIGSVAGLLFVRFTPFITLICLPLLVYQGEKDLNEFFDHFELKKVASVLLAGIIGFNWFYTIGLRDRIVANTGILLPFYSAGLDEPKKWGFTTGWGMGYRYQTNVPERILQNYPNQKVANSYTIGGFLIWEWWPYKKVLIDSKISAYEPKFVEKYLHNKSHRHQYYLNTNMNLVVFERGSIWTRRYFFPAKRWRYLVSNGSLVAFNVPDSTNK